MPQACDRCPKPNALAIVEVCVALKPFIPTDPLWTPAASEWSPPEMLCQHHYFDASIERAPAGYQRVRTKRWLEDLAGEAEWDGANG